VQPDTGDTAALHTVQPEALKTFADMVTNGTSWDYPLDVHAAICCDLKINPRTWVVPAFIKQLWSSHFPDYEDLGYTEAFSDEIGNVVYFFDADWSDKYRLWLIHHELYHQSQFFDKGNARGRRWEHLGTRQEVNTWEKEACAYANKKVGTVVDDFQPYKSVVITDPIPATRQKASPRFVMGKTRRNSPTPHPQRLFHL
jgi:hypothetical protein